MTIETQELLRICEQLPETLQSQVTNYARSLLPSRNAAAAKDRVEHWLRAATGGATVRITTDEVMAVTRGDA